MFRNLLFSAIGAGVAVAVCVTLIQSFTTEPLILGAEVFEKAEAHPVGPLAAGHAETAEPAAAVVPAVVGEPRRAVRVAAAALASGVRVGCFRPPSVPHGRSCLRLTARANLTSADLELAQRALTGALGSSSLDTSPAVRGRDEGADP